MIWICFVLIVVLSFAVVNLDPCCSNFSKRRMWSIQTNCHVKPSFRNLGCVEYEIDCWLWQICVQTKYYSAISANHTPLQQEKIPYLKSRNHVGIYSLLWFSLCLDLLIQLWRFLARATKGTLLYVWVCQSVCHSVSQCVLFYFSKLILGYFQIM